MVMSDDRIKRLSTRFVAERHALMGFIYGMVRDLAAAEDIFQEIWIRLQEAAARGEPIADPARWCRGVAKNLILHYWRDKRVGKVVTDSELLDLVEQALNEQPEDSSDRRQALMECIDRLPQKSRQLLQLKYDEGLSFAAMAERLKRSVDGLKMALCRVRQALLECAQRKLGLASPTDEAPG
jgi:RNA polymerase sigma-70 factor (ECF subfamily)